MKIVYIVLISAAVIVAAYFCFNCGNSCSSEKCKSPNKTEAKKSNACGSCGKNSCDKTCSTNPNDTSDLKSLVPSCNLSNDEMIERKEFLQKSMVKKIVRTEELETGFDLIFNEPIEYSKELLEFINFERGCCASFTFALIFDPNNKATHLQIYGSKEIKEELRVGFIEVGFLKK